MFARRLLMAARGGGSFLSMGYTMTAEEVLEWQDLAALLDPLAYEYVEANNSDQTVPANEVWYVQEGWNLESSVSAANWFHRGGDVRDSVPISSGTVLGTDEDPAGPGAPAHMYLCKPSLVTGSDARYTSDPRGLYFERMRRLKTELAQYTIGHANTGSGQVSTTLPDDFTNGMYLHVSTQDVAWVIPRYVSTDSGLITQMEINDADPIRVAAVALIPFVRDDFPDIVSQGSSLSTGRVVLRYSKLPVDW